MNEILAAETALDSRIESQYMGMCIDAFAFDLDDIFVDHGTATGPIPLTVVFCSIVEILHSTSTWCCWYNRDSHESNVPKGLIRFNKGHAHLCHTRCTCTGTASSICIYCKVLLGVLTY